LVLYHTSFLFTSGSYGSIDDIHNILENYRNKTHSPQNYKNDWGCYNIQDSNIQIQTFGQTQFGGPIMRVFEQDGRIINDTTFVLLKSKVKGGESKMYNFIDSFHYYPFIKPDSANWLERNKCK
jgi:hypothetical protein